MWLFALLVAVPIVEIALFIQVGGWIGLWPTLALVVLTAVAGAVLMRAQGRGALVELQSRLDRGGDPTGPMAHGALILFAGALLLTPGFFTDATGLLLLLPPVRSALIAWGATRLAGHVRVRHAAFRTGPGPRGDVVEGEFTVVDEAPEDDDRDGPRPPTRR